MKESQFSKLVTKYLQEKGALVTNIAGGSNYQRVGVSDLLVCYKGHFIALELKVGTYSPDPLQLSYLLQVRKAGGIGIVLRDTIDELEIILYLIDNNAISEYRQHEIKIGLEEIIFD